MQAQTVARRVDEARTTWAELDELAPYGNGRGRYYAAGEPLRAIRHRRREDRKPLRDPYPWMHAKL